jgi:hypothetical protein
MSNSLQIVSMPVASPVEAGLSRQQALADQLTSAPAAPSLLAWRSEPAFLVSRTETRLPHFEDTVADMRPTGWPVVLRKCCAGSTLRCDAAVRRNALGLRT